MQVPNGLIDIRHGRNNRRGLKAVTKIIRSFVDTDCQLQNKPDVAKEVRKVITAFNRECTNTNKRKTTAVQDQLFLSFCAAIDKRPSIDLDSNDHSPHATEDNDSLVDIVTDEMFGESADGETMKELRSIMTIKGTDAKNFRDLIRDRLTAMGNHKKYPVRFTEYPYTSKRYEHRTH